MSSKEGGSAICSGKSDDFEFTALMFPIIALQGHGAVALEAWLLGEPED